MSGPLALLPLAVLLLATAPAQGETLVRLKYGTAPGLSNCPGESTLREAVVAHLGRDPFSAEAQPSVEIYIRKGHAQLIATTETRGLDAGAPGKRELTGTLAECSELVSSLALAIAIAIDPRALAGPIPVDPLPAPKPPPQPVAKPLVKPPRKAIPESANSRSTTSVSAALGALGTWRDQPGAGGFLGLRYHSTWGELGVEAQATRDTPRKSAQGRIETTYVMAGLLACLSGQLKLCAAGGLGAVMIAASGYNRAQQGWLMQATLGPRLEWAPVPSLPLIPQAHLRVHLEVPLALQTTRLLLGNQVVGQLPSFGLQLGLSFFLDVHDGSRSLTQP